MKTLKKSLKLTDVVAISVGAMFSSGFFLLPGLAFAHTGPSVFLAYIVSGFLILPSMLSQAELSTAMPKAGGTYYFLDRAFGPLLGTVGGLGTFLGLILKTAFALIGFGAYLQLYVDISIQSVALSLAGIFILLNLIGAKESSRLQKILVALLITAMSVFIVEGLNAVSILDGTLLKDRFSNFFRGGFGEFFYTIAFVFVSYAGLTKVASVAEEIENPDRNIPLGMIISLILTVLIYGLGIFVVVALVPGAELMNDLKPIATAEPYVFNWIEGSIGMILVTAAALAAFASTGNAGILACSRYPLAMAKDKLIPSALGKLNRFGVPTRAILFTGALIILVIVTQSEEGIAKFASAFQLLLFILINSAVIVMRESKLEGYDPGYKSPFYPWTQLFGIIISAALLIYMGTTLLVVLLGTIVCFLAWYYGYAAKRVLRQGAIFHWFGQLAKNRSHHITDDLWEIMKEKGIREDDPIYQIVSEATIIDHNGPIEFTNLVQKAAQVLASKSEATEAELIQGLIQKCELGSVHLVSDLSMSGLRLVDLKTHHLVIIRCPQKFSITIKDIHGDEQDSQQGTLALFLLSPELESTRYLRLMANWTQHAIHNNLAERCIQAKTENELRAILLSETDIDLQDSTKD